jgi:hypothetical protein
MAWIISFAAKTNEQ